MFTNVLAATDRVTVSDMPVLTAARIAEKNNGKSHIIHVLESPSKKNRRLIKHYKTGEKVRSGAAYEDAVKKEIKKVYDDVLRPDGNYEIRVTTGFPWEEILRWSRQISTDLIVLGPHSTRAEEEGVVRVVGKIGSTVEGVIMRENCPVMLVNPTIQIERLAFKRILVGIDFSKSCECALCLAVELSRKYGSTLFLFHMIPVPPLPKYSKTDYEADRGAATQRLHKFCRGFLENTDYEYSVRGGALPHLEILKYAEKKDTDLIVMGSHTKEKAGKWYAGSVVERVGFRSKSPVVVVTDPEVLFTWEDDLTSIIRRETDTDRSIQVFSKKKNSG